MASQVQYQLFKCAPAAFDPLQILKKSVDGWNVTGEIAGEKLASMLRSGESGDSSMLSFSSMITYKCVLDKRLESKTRTGLHLYCASAHLGCFVLWFAPKMF